MLHVASVRRRHERNLARRFTAGPMLAGRLPSSVQARDSSIAMLPALPEHVVLAILALADEARPVDPLAVRWLRCYGRSWIDTKAAQERFG